MSNYRSIEDIVHSSKIRKSIQQVQTDVKLLKYEESKRQKINLLYCQSSLKSNFLKKISKKKNITESRDLRPLTTENYRIERNKNNNKLNNNVRLNSIENQQINEISKNKNNKKNSIRIASYKSTIQENKVKKKQYQQKNKKIFNKRQSLTKQISVGKIERKKKIISKAEIDAKNTNFGVLRIQFPQCLSNKINEMKKNKQKELFRTQKQFRSEQLQINRERNKQVQNQNDKSDRKQSKEKIPEFIKCNLQIVLKNALKKTKERILISRYPMEHQYEKMSNELNNEKYQQQIQDYQKDQFKNELVIQGIKGIHNRVSNQKIIQTKKQKQNKQENKQQNKQENKQQLEQQIVENNNQNNNQIQNNKNSNKTKRKIKKNNLKNKKKCIFEDPKICGWGQQEINNIHLKQQQQIW